MGRLLTVSHREWGLEKLTSNRILTNGENTLKGSDNGHYADITIALAFGFFAYENLAFGFVSNRFPENCFLIFDSDFQPGRQVSK